MAGKQGGVESRGCYDTRVDVGWREGDREGGVRGTEEGGGDWGGFGVVRGVEVGEVEAGRRWGW